MEAAGGIVIALDDGGCEATRYIAMLEPAVGAGMRKKASSIPDSVSFWNQSLRQSLKTGLTTLFNKIRQNRSVMWLVNQTSW